MTTPQEIIQILLVEDNEADVALTREFLESSGVPSALHVVGDGAAALDFVSRRGAYGDAPRPSMVLLDSHLPDRDGEEIVAALRAAQPVPHVPVLMLSGGEPSGEDIVADGFLSKPLSSGAFERALALLNSAHADMGEMPQGADAPDFSGPTRRWG